jgi:hypothetical protein
MPDTMKTMELTYVDLLTPGQLMINDFIEIENEVVEILEIETDALGDNYFIIYRNDDGEKEIATVEYHDTVKLYVYIDSDE